MSCLKHSTDEEELKL